MEPGSKAVGGEVGMIAENVFSKALQGFCLAKCGNHGNVRQNLPEGHKSECVLGSVVCCQSPAASHKLEGNGF